MAKKKAPVSLTGGSGFNFEDDVAAHFLLDMLTGIASFGVEHGQVVQVDWQVRDSDWLLDDLAVTLESAAGRRTAALSVKSHRQITEAGFPDNFVEAVWEQWLHTTSNVFTEGRDLLGMVTGKIADQVMTSWETLLTEAIGTTPERMLARLQAPVDASQGAQSSHTERALFKSLRCPQRLRSLPDTDDAATVWLVRHVRVLHFDFEQEPSRDEAEAVAGCQRILRSGDLETARQMWGRLKGIAAENRGQGGSLGVAALVGILRSEFDLWDYPDHKADWEVLGKLSTEVMEDVYTDIAGAVSLLRPAAVTSVQKALDQRRLCLLVGESGSGKSAVGKITAMRHYDRVIWPPAGALESGRSGGFEQELGLRHPLQDLLRASAGTCLLVFDSTEKYSDVAVRLLGRILTEIRADGNCRHVHVLLVTHVEAATRLVDVLRREGVEADALQPVTVGNASGPEIGVVVSVIPNLSWATVQKDLWPVLGNLKVLDLLARAGLSGMSMERQTRIGLPALIDFIWEGWIRAGADGLARGGVLQQIGILESEGLAVGVPVVKLEHAQQAVLPALESVGLVRVRRERVFFRHDLLGDWARLRVLLGEEPVGAAELRKRASSPRWHPALRLFARGILVQPDGVQRWRRVIEDPGDGGVGSTLLRDLFVEAVVVAENAGQLLELVWPVLVANDARLLALLLDRFLYVATVPDPRIRRIPGRESVAAHIEATYRIPFWPYWGPVIATFRRHVEEIIRQAPRLAARVCHLWLENMPWELEEGRPFPWRLEAAELAIAIAREVQAITAGGTYLPDDLERSAYETALLAAADLPDESAAITLELSQRRDLLPEIRQRVEQARRKAKAEAQARSKDPALARLRRSYPRLSRFEGPVQKPWPDGPRSRVAAQFQEACLNGKCLLPLIVRRPDVALEVLLAACIEEPKRLDPSRGDSLIKYYGVEDWRGGYPPMYFRGPFLGFLRESPKHGLSFVLRLVNFGTRRWADSEKVHAARSSSRLRLTDEDLGVHIETGGSDRLWFGDGRVLRWHSDWPLDSKVLSCALMALEKWLYDEMDAGRDISPWIGRILAESESLAFAGLLLDLGKRVPSLFVTQLRDLLTGWELYHWDHQAVVERTGMHAGLMGWWRDPKELMDLAREWHTASYRARLLFDIAVWLLRKDEMQPFFAELRSKWSERLDSEGRPRDLRRLIERINPANYRTQQGENGTILWVSEWPEELRERTEQESHIAGQQMQFLTFPFRCREILDGKKQIAPSYLDDFWKELTWIAGLEPSESEEDPAFVSRQQDAVCGGSAVLVCRYREWLREDPAREQWCLAMLRSAVEERHPQDVFDVPDSVGEHHWDVFVGDAGVALLSEDRGNVVARRLVAAGATAYHHAAIGQTMRLAFQNRDTLGDLFQQTCSLAAYWAAVRFVSARSERLEIDVERWRDRGVRLRKAFVKGRLRNAVGRLGQLSRWGIRAEKRLERKRFPKRLGAGGRHELQGSAPRQLWRETPGLDMGVVVAMFGWLDLLDLTLQKSRDLLLGTARDLLTITMQGLPAVPEGEDDDIEDPRFEFDNWVLGQIARAIAVVDRPEDRASLWRPILDLGKPGNGWVEHFFWGWFSQGVQAAGSPESFVNRWREMIDHALGHPLWDPDRVGAHNLDEMVGEMLGFDFGIQAVADDEQFASAMGSMVEIFSRAAAKWFRIGDIANGFAVFVVRPAAGRLLESGVQWLHDACQKFNDYFDWRAQNIEEHFVAVLSACWERHATNVATDNDLQRAFLGLANLLSARGCHAALVLRDRVLASLPGR